MEQHKLTPTLNLGIPMNATHFAIALALDPRGRFMLEGNKQMM